MMDYKILLICDNKYIGLTFQYYLEQKGYNVTHALTSTQALKLYSSLRPNLVLIVYSSFGEPPDREQLCLYLRAIMSDHYVPIFMVSSSLQEAQRAGATEWFDIIYDLNAIHEKIQVYRSEDVS